MMRIGFHASCLLLHDEVAVVGELAAIGYQSVAIRPRCGNLDPNDDRFPQQMERLAAAVKEHKMTLMIDTAGAFLTDLYKYHGPSLAANDSTESDHAEASVARWIEIANIYGAPIVTFSSGKGTPPPGISVRNDETTLDRLAVRLNRLTERSVSAGVRLALRPASGEAVATVARFERLGQWMAQPDTLFLAADVAEMLKEGEFPVADRLARNLPRLACVYLCEREADRSRDQIPAKCELDLHRITTSLRQLRYTGVAIARIDGHSEQGLSLAQDALEWFSETG